MRKAGRAKPLLLLSSPYEGEGLGMGLEKKKREFEELKMKWEMLIKLFLSFICVFKIIKNIKLNLYWNLYCLSLN
ncbi:MAG: hypothetical protein K8S23_09345 [Candidatus Cloacimonetes bacterium]|nr:hypothetical protein [Candidatus Cloacimonadota bacterium]